VLVAADQAEDDGLHSTFQIDSCEAEAELADFGLDL